jgi:hypothetical protein
MVRTTLTLLMVQELLFPISPEQLRLLLLPVVVLVVPLMVVVAVLAEFLITQQKMLFLGPNIQ